MLVYASVEQCCSCIRTCECCCRQTLRMCFPSPLVLLHYFYLLFPSVSFIMVRGKREIKKKKASIGRQSERSHSVMLSATHNALQVDSWHILYIFPLGRSLTKCLLMYSSQEMNFYLREPECCCSLSLPPVWSLGFTNIQEIQAHKHTWSPEAEITNEYCCRVRADATRTQMLSQRVAGAAPADMNS